MAIRPTETASAHRKPFCLAASVLSRVSELQEDINAEADGTEASGRREGPQQSLLTDVHRDGRNGHPRLCYQHAVEEVTAPGAVGIRLGAGTMYLDLVVVGDIPVVVGLDP